MEFRLWPALCTTNAKLYFSPILGENPCSNQKRGIDFFHRPSGTRTRRIAYGDLWVQAQQINLSCSCWSCSGPHERLLIQLSAVTLSDEDLVLQAQHGDRVALGAPFDRYASLVLGIGLRTRKRLDAAFHLHELSRYVRRRGPPGFQLIPGVSFSCGQPCCVSAGRRR